jgi:hypothetical protein
MVRCLPKPCSLKPSNGAFRRVIPPQSREKGQSPDAETHRGNRVARQPKHGQAAEIPLPNLPQDGTGKREMTARETA